MTTNEKGNGVFEPGDLITVDELRSRLKVPKSWVYNHCGLTKRKRLKNPLPAKKCGRFLRFSWTEVCAWLNARSVKGKAA